jgi:rhamnulokinase
MSTGSFIAVDLGASGGRVMLGHAGTDTLRLSEISRFRNGPVALPDGLHWDVLGLYTDALDGMRQAAQTEPDVLGLAVDTWAVDYGLLDALGRLLGNPYHYRDGRTAAAVAHVHRQVDAQALYQINGLQHLPFNTLYQFRADGAALASAATALLIPDLLGYWLTGERVTEQTNASTTGLLNARSAEWDRELIDTLGLPSTLLPPLISPGTVVGPLTHAVLDHTGLPASAVVTAVGSHDTASAVVAVPAETGNFAYISCGTWALVGVELDEPLLTEDSRQANFTNERGVDGTVRYLRNVMGLWLVQECQRVWQLAGSALDLNDLIGAAATLHAGPVIDPNAPEFLSPGDMPTRIAAACTRLGGPPPRTPPEFVRCILDSLAAAFATSVADARRLSGKSVDVVHMVGGGSRNSLLCQLTANACRLPVVAGPVEATALGNVAVQARTRGIIDGDLAMIRRLVRHSHPTRTYRPEPS